MAENQQKTAIPVKIEQSFSDKNPTSNSRREIETDAKIGRLLLSDNGKRGVTTAEIAEKVGGHAIDRIGTMALRLGWIVQHVSESGSPMPDCWDMSSLGRRVFAQRVDMYDGMVKRQMAAGQ